MEGQAHCIRFAKTKGKTESDAEVNEQILVSIAGCRASSRRREQRVAEAGRPKAQRRDQPP